MRHEILYVSNLITISRLFLLAFTIYFLLSDLYFTSAILIVLIWFSDLLDGYAARRRNEVSEFGKIIDPVADKICIMAICVILLMKHLVPAWFIIVLISRDITILTGGLYLKKSRNVVLQSNIAGKISVFIIGLTLMFIIVNAGVTKNSFIRGNAGIWELISNVLIFSSLVMVIISLINYSKRFLNFTK